MNELSTARARAETLLANLLDAPAYLVWQSQNPPNENIIANCWAMTGRTADVLFREWLVERDRWFGRAPLIYVNDKAIAQFSESREECMQRLQCAVIHEAAHVCETDIDTRDINTAVAKEAGVVAAASRALCNVQSPPAYLPPYFGHRAGFVRCAVHAHWRAWQLHDELRYDLPMVVDATMYDTDPHFFARALGHEMRELRMMPIGEVRHVPPPAAFTELWQRIEGQHDSTTAGTGA